MTKESTIHVGGVEITSVSDGTLSFDRARFFPDVPEQAWAPYMAELTPDGQVQMNVGSFVLRSEGKTILVDTGLGPNALSSGDSDCGHLIDDIMAKAVPPSEVDLVLLTHIHIDHVGWNLTYEGTTAKETFPQARYLVPKLDWEASTTKAERAKSNPNEALVRETRPFLDQVQPLQATGKLDLFEGEHAVTSSITTLPTPGHTPGHTAILIQSEGERAIITGDLLHLPLEVHEVTWTSRADADAAQAVASRIEVLDQVEQDGSLLLGGHLPSPGFGRLVRLKGRRYWQAL